MPQRITVRIENDPEAGVWYIAESSLFGLHPKANPPMRCAPSSPARSAIWSLTPARLPST